MGVWSESKYDPKHCETAVKVLSGGKSLAAVCVAIGCARSTLYEWRNTYPEFKKALDLGLQQSQAVLEDLGMRGMEGEIKSFAGSPWIFTMKNRFREDYAAEAELLIGQNDRMRAEIKELREQLDEQNKRDY